MMKRKSILSLIIAVCFLSLGGSVYAESSPPVATLNASELLELYKSMYSSIHNMNVSYTQVQERVIPFKGDPNLFEKLVYYKRVERIDEDGKLYIRYSTQPDGFKRSVEITEQAYDGSATMQYWAKTKTGAVRSGQVGLGRIGDKNDFLRFMLLTFEKSFPGTRPHQLFPGGARHIEVFVDSEGKVRPELEKVCDRWCHVVETYWQGYEEPTTITWFAAGSGGLPVRFEKYFGRGECTERIVVEEIATTGEGVNRIWYPKKAVRILYKGSETISYKLTCHELRVNIRTSENTWKVSFPAGTVVYDRVNNLTYRAVSEQ